MWHKPCRTFHPWCPCIKTRCLFGYFGSQNGIQRRSWIFFEFFKLNFEFLSTDLGRPRGATRPKRVIVEFEENSVIWLYLQNFQPHLVKSLCDTKFEIWFFERGCKLVPHLWTMLKTENFESPSRFCFSAVWTVYVRIRNYVRQRVNT